MEARLLDVCFINPSQSRRGNCSPRRCTELTKWTSVEYDRIGDILYLGTVSPYPEQESEELDYGVVARLNPQSGEIENLEILFFSSRVASGEALQLPVLAEFHLPERV